jgi:hypothetical protein
MCIQEKKRNMAGLNKTIILPFFSSKISSQFSNGYFTRAYSLSNVQRSTYEGGFSFTKIIPLFEKASVTS